MAMRRSRTNAFGRRRRTRAPLRWTAQNIQVSNSLSDQAQGTATLIGFGELISPNDYRQTSALEPDGATVVRMVGHVSVDCFFQAETGDPFATMPVRCNPAIMLLSQQETFPSFSVQALIDRRFLWWRDETKVIGNAMVIPTANISAVRDVDDGNVGNWRSLAFNWDFDLRARVKLQQLQSVQFGVTVAIGNGLVGTDVLDIQGDCLARSLLKGSF